MTATRPRCRAASIGESTRAWQRARTNTATGLPARERARFDHSRWHSQRARKIRRSQNPPYRTWAQCPTAVRASCAPRRCRSCIHIRSQGRRVLPRSRATDSERSRVPLRRSSPAARPVGAQECRDPRKIAARGRRTPSPRALGPCRESRQCRARPGNPESGTVPRRTSDCGARCFHSACANLLGSRPEHFSTSLAQTDRAAALRHDVPLDEEPAPNLRPHRCMHSPRESRTAAHRRNSKPAAVRIPY